MNIKVLRTILNSRVKHCVEYVHILDLNISPLPLADKIRRKYEKYRSSEVIETGKDLSRQGCEREYLKELRISNALKFILGID